MSLTFPSIFRSSQTLPSPSFEAREFDLPLHEVKILPYDTAAGDLAKRALLLSGVEILQKEFDVKDPIEARQRVSRLADEVSAIGYETEFVLESEYSDIEDRWETKAVTGDDAELTLMSLTKLAKNPDQGFYADRAADVLGAVSPDDTRIALK